MMTRRALAAAAAALLAGPAAADGFTLYDLGEMPSREACMSRADKVLNGYLRLNGGLEVASTDWAYYGYDFRPGDQDVTVMCPIFHGDFVNAMLVVYGEEDSDENRAFTAEEINRLWGN